MKHFKYYEDTSLSRIAGTHPPSIDVSRNTPGTEVGATRLCRAIY